MTAAETVDAFLAAICRNDLEGALAFCAHGIVYDNVPIGPVEGHDGVRSVLTGFLAGASEIDWVVHRQLADDSVVLNTRTDRFLMGERWLELPVAGLFEVVDGKITLWRDYFDMPTLTAQMAG